MSRAAAATLTRTRWAGTDAFCLSDGKTEAVVVPAWSGRVMRYGAVGGPNRLWNAPPRCFSGGAGYKNRGGDKTFVGPHGAWGLFAPTLWPPQPTWDGPPHRAEVLPGGRLRTAGPAWAGFHTRVAREYGFSARGELIIKQTLETLAGGPLPLSVWSVSQGVPPEAVFLPLNPASPYKNGFHWMGAPAPRARIQPVSATLLEVRPTIGGSYKIGVDAPVAAIAAVQNGVAWVQRAPRPPGEYPDGATGAGFPVEFYNHGEDGAGQYVELELLSPLRPFRKNSRWTHTVRWSLHPLPGRDAGAHAVRAVIEKLLTEEPS